MATIKAFNPIRPNPQYASELIFAKPQAESVAGDFTNEGQLKPLKTLLETGARLRPETPEGQALAYEDIRLSLKNLLDKQQLYREELPGIYIYEVVHPGYRQTGVWALTALKDYREGHIKIHELTFADSVRRLKNYRENTGLEGSPILLTYYPTMAINLIIAEVKANYPKATLNSKNGTHAIWKIREPNRQEALMEAFAHIQTAYLADGHHRIESADQSAAEYIAALYMATDQLRIEAYHRIVIPNEPVHKAVLFKQLNQICQLQESTGNWPVLPKEPEQLGMYLEGQWYHLLAKSFSYPFTASFVQEQLLSKIFGITGPRTDSRLKCAGGEKAMEEIRAILSEHPSAIVFTLPAMTVAQLTSLAEAGVILPPKSTWIVPKVPYGLLINQHQTIIT